MESLEILREALTLIKRAAEGFTEQFGEAVEKVAELFGVSTDEAQQAFETLVKILRTSPVTLKKIEESRTDRERFRRNERAENARRAAVFKQYTRSADRWGAARRTRPRNRDFKPP